MGEPCPHEALPTDRLRELEADRHRWRNVVTAAQEFARTQAAWREQAERGLKPDDEVTHHRAAAMATLLLYVRDLESRDAWVWTCGCGDQTALTSCANCGMERPPPPEKVDRHQAIIDAAFELTDAKIEGEAEREAEAWIALGEALGRHGGLGIGVPSLAQRVRDLEDLRRELEDALEEQDRRRAEQLAQAADAIEAVDEEKAEVERERERLRRVIEDAIRAIEQAQFTGHTCDTCTATYRALNDEAIAPRPGKSK